MLRTLKLLLPALLPSWRFFDVIGPSLRIQFTLLGTEHETPYEWQEFRPRPTQLSLAKMLKRMVWNPVWNESLFLISCAENLLEQPTRHDANKKETINENVNENENEILTRIINELKRDTSTIPITAATHLQFRLLLVQRQGSALQQKVSFHSRIQPLSAQDTA